MAKNYISVEAAKALKEIGFNEGCENSWVRSYGVSQWAQETFPGLSDDGYLDLTKEYGGEYEEDEIYELREKVTRHYSRNIGWGEDEYVICSCPSIEQVIEWLFEKYHILLSVCHDTFHPWGENNIIISEQHFCYYYKMTVLKHDNNGQLRWVVKNHTHGSYKEYMGAWNAGIIKCVNYIKQTALRNERF